jgi:hypothetical protein
MGTLIYLYRLDYRTEPVLTDLLWIIRTHLNQAQPLYLHICVLYLIPNNS